MRKLQELTPRNALECFLAMGSTSKMGSRQSCLHRIPGNLSDCVLTYKLYMGASYVRVILYTPEYKTSHDIECLLRGSEFQVFQTSNKEEAFLVTKDFDVSLIVVVVNDCHSGLVSLVKTFRAHAPKPPLILITVKSQTLSKVECLNSGADDVISRDLENKEIMARIRAVVRRSFGLGESVLRAGALQMNLESRNVTVAGSPVRLTRKESDVLKLLLLKQKIVLDRQAILSSVWDVNAEPDTRLVDLLVFQLRRKLASHGLTDAIETVRGCGYRLSECLLEKQACEVEKDGWRNQQGCFPFFENGESSPAKRPAFLC